MDIHASFGDFTDERRDADEECGDDIYCGIGIMVDNVCVVALTYEEAENLGNSLVSIVEAFRRFKRESIAPKMAEMLVAAGSTKRP